MKLNDAIKIAVLPGDGIGVDVTHAAIPIFKALNIPVALNFGDIGWSYWQSEGTPIPGRTWRLIAESDTLLLGAITSKPQREANAERALAAKQIHDEYVSPIIQLRQQLDLFANVRPCFSVKEDNHFNCCVIRENTEGLYAGFDYYPIPEEIHNLLADTPRWQAIADDEISGTLRLQTKSGLMRLFSYAFDYADSHEMARVTFADKPNVLRQSANFSRELFELVASRYPHIKADILNVDAVALWLIRRPEEFGVIVAENMFGDILSDVGAGVMGGLGFAPSANIGQKGCYFEPVHGSAPRIQPNSANPSAMFLTISMLLNHFGYLEEGKKIVTAVAAVVKQNRFVTYDLGGNASTQAMSDAIIDHCLSLGQETNTQAFYPPPIEQMPATPIANEFKQVTRLQQLQEFTTSEISDALDACGIEGCLLDMKPLLAGHKLIGSAYTLSYLPYDEPLSTFKGAADYIDSVPESAVIVIDNNGQLDCSVWGDILTQVALKRGIAGTVVHGAVRDVESIKKANYPLFCSGITMRSGKNRVYKANEQSPLNINGVLINPGDIIFADNNGVLVIPFAMIDDIINKAQNVKKTEERIRQAVDDGATLKEARREHHYDKPWLDIEKK